MIAEIVVSISSSNLDKPFSYIIPDNLKESAKTGARVIVPFGRGNKPVEGFILDVKDEESTQRELKSIISFPDKAPLINDDLMSLAKWMQDKYYSTLTECIKCIMPAGISIKSETLYYLNSIVECELTGVSEAIFAYMEQHAPVSKKVIQENVKGVNDSHINSLLKKNVITKDMTAAGNNFTLFEKRVSLNGEVLPGVQIPSEKTKQGQVYRYLQDMGEVSVKSVREALSVTDSPINALVQKGIAVMKMVEIRRKSPLRALPEQSGAHTLTNEQKEALQAILKMMDSNEKKPVLLHGVTGSGKTEIYLKAIEKVIESGKQGIVLVPEISLTPQTVGRFKNRFGDMVSVTHSRMSNSERYDQWKNAAEGKIQVMIGPRSALFTPFSKLGIIIIDEEHENTYKSETTPKYDARFTAIQRASITGAVVVLGSATPSMDSYHKALSGEYLLMKMKNRINMAMPSVDIIDMRAELLSGNRSMFSTKLMEGISENLNSGLQTILFLNRRGHSTFVSCRQCGYVVKCESCNINFTYHIYNDRLICHYCAAEEETPRNCPQCGSKYIKYFGVGTQKVEEEVNKLFPGARVLRMDMDTTSKKGGHENILEAFRTGKADILIGTQMIAKGLDFPRVTLVGVVAADLSLNSGDYRSAENTFQLLTQVSGRSGRADYKGNVVIQTYNPEHYAIVYSRTSDYESFYEHESALRRQMNYPPYSHVFSVLLTGESEKKVINALYRLCDIIKIYNNKDYFELIGPSPAMLSKLKGKYRWKLIVKAHDEKKLRNFVLYCTEKLRLAGDLENINISLTIDPAVSV